MGWQFSGLCGWPPPSAYHHEAPAVISALSLTVIVINLFTQYMSLNLFPHHWHNQILSLLIFLISLILNILSSLMLPFQLPSCLLYMTLTYVCTNIIFYKFTTHELKHLAVILSTKSLWTDVYVGEYSFSIKLVILACADEQSSSVDKPEVSYCSYVPHKLKKCGISDAQGNQPHAL